MFNSLFGLTVLRSVPEDTVWGLLSGRYTMHGGVIRWAAGTEHAGQIVRHLIPAPGTQFQPVTSFAHLPGPFSISQLVRSPDLALMSRQVLQLATGTMMLSGLNLAVSAIGFGMLSYHLCRIDARLEAIQAEIKAIHELLKRKERAELRAALQNMLNSDLIEDKTIRQQFLMNAHGTFSTMVHLYRELLVLATSAQEALAVEEYYCLVMLARARCSAELGQLELAQHELKADVKVWIKQARRIARDILIGKHPERFLYRDMADVAPAAALVEWLDFANDDPKGYGWIDVVRRDMGHWHRTEAVGITFHGAYSKEKERVYEHEIVVPGLARLTARHQTLEGHVAQLGLLKKLNATPSAFEQRLEQLAPLAVEGFLIVEGDHA